MTTSDKVFKDSASGETFSFTRTGADTGGELLEIKTDYRPNSAKPPSHYHPKQQEHFEVVEGGMTVEMQGKQRVYHAGESFDIPQDIPHAMWNAGDVTARVIWQIRPALNSQTLFETVWGLRQDGKVGKNGTPNLLQAAVMMRTYDNEFRLVSPPPLVQKILFVPLGFIGRLLGYKARYETYSG